jgi:hypothetical protein
MIKTNSFIEREDGTKLYKTYFDNEKINLLQNETNIIYNEAIDIENSEYTYSEVEKSKEENVKSNKGEN